MTHFLPRRMRALLDPLPVLETPRLILRPITQEDADDMYAYSRDPETSRYLLWEPHTSRDTTVSHIRQLLRQYKAHSFFDWAIVDKESGHMIGTVGFTRLSALQYVGELGYVLSPAFHRQRIAPEAAERVIAFGFQNLLLKSIVCRIMEDNVPSRKVAGRMGFRFTGFEKEIVIKRGVRQRVARYVLTREAHEAG